MPDAPKADEISVKEADELLKESKNNNDWESALNILRKFDQIRSEKIVKNDWYRMTRYLEIALAIRRDSLSKSNDPSTIDDFDELNKPIVTGARTPVLEGVDIRAFFLTEDRFNLFHTIDKRCESMLKNGLINEVSELLIKGILKEEYPVSKSIGYRQTIQYLKNEYLEPFDIKAFDQYLR